jgi:hypothetical protein
MDCDTHTHFHPLLEQDLCSIPGPRPEKGKSSLRLTSCIIQDICSSWIQILQSVISFDNNFSIDVLMEKKILN